MTNHTTPVSVGGEAAPEGCTPADARMLRAANHGLASENDRLRKALEFYAEGGHFTIHDTDVWDTVSGEPANFWEDESNTATVEDGSVAKAALASQGSGGDEGMVLVRVPITEEMHVAAVKVLCRATGIDGLPQRMLDAMLAASPVDGRKQP